MFGFSQTWNYTFTDPCTLNQQTVTNTIGQSIALNYFGNVQSFTENDFTNGVFDNWINSVTQINSSSPCESITQVIVNTSNSTVVATTLTVVTNIMSVMGGSMLPPAESINNSSNGNDSEEEDEKNTKTNGSNTNKKRSTNSTQTDQGNQEAKGNQSSTKTSRGSNSNTTGGSSNTDKSAEAGEQKTESPVEDNEGASTQAVANSLANAIDGGDNEQSNESGKNSGSLIASGDIVVISNQDNSNGEQFRFVGSITHSNTDNSRIKGALFTYTSVTNDASVTLYKSWINPKKTFNLVLANTTLTNFKTDVSNTTTVLESFRFGKQKKYTGMAGINYTYGKLGERNLQNLSSVAGVHRNFKVSPRISTSFLMLGVYSPFTQFYEGKWFSAGLLVVPFSSWDIKITKTFKYNISFTGVWQTSGSALNYQILTGGKINF